MKKIETTEKDTVEFWTVYSMIYIFFAVWHKVQYIYKESTTLYVPASELGLSNLLSRKRVWGGGVVPVPTTGEKA